MLDVNYKEDWEADSLYDAEDCADKSPLIGDKSKCR